MPSELVTLQAFVAALAELDSPLDLEVQKKVNEVGECWENQPMLMANKLIEVAGSYPVLMGHYAAAHKALFKLYSANSKDKCIFPPTESNIVPPSRDTETTNILEQRDKTDSTYRENDEKSPEQIESKLCSVLRAQQSVKRAKELKEELTKQPEVTTELNKLEENPNKKVRIVDRIKDLINFLRNGTETTNPVNNSEQQSSEQAPYYVWVSTIF
ncbi:hypothetical protein [Microcoleus sp. S13_B4]|uniref:hypothetical protein n=1 Tax=Microcoleus sp. S13_B4 TaxID=3055408 RepID=UPI002FD617BF